MFAGSSLTVSASHGTGNHGPCAVRVQAPRNILVHPPLVLAHGRRSPRFTNVMPTGRRVGGGGRRIARGGVDEPDSGRPNTHPGRGPPTDPYADRRGASHRGPDPREARRSVRAD